MKRPLRDGLPRHALSQCVERTPATRRNADRLLMSMSFQTVSQGTGWRPHCQLGGVPRATLGAFLLDWCLCPSLNPGGRFSLSGPV